MRCILKITNPDTNKYCKVNINIDNIIENYYQISLTYDYEDMKDVTPQKHIDYPFKDTIFFKNNFSIIKNDLTKKMIDYLLLNNTLLSEQTGTITPLQYKINILRALSMLYEYEYE